MAVPQTPIKWIRLRSLNGRFLDHDRGARARLDTHVDAKWQRPAWPCGVSGRESEDNRSGKIGRELRDDFTGGHRPIWLVATRHLPKDQRSCAPQDAAEAKLRQHAVDAIRPLVDVFQKQHAAVRRVKGVWRTEGRNQ